MAWRYRSREPASIAAKSLAAARARSTVLTRSKNSVQSTVAMRRMLVITFRTVRLVAPWRSSSSATMRSGLLPWADRRESNHANAGVTSGSWSRSRSTSWAANAIASGPAGCRSIRAVLAVAPFCNVPTSASAAARSAAWRIMPCAARRRFSTSSRRSMTGSAHSSPIVKGCTAWWARTKHSSSSGSRRLSVWATNARARPNTRGRPHSGPSVNLGSWQR